MSAAENAATATDPVCGMQVSKADGAITATHEGKHYYFCSEVCQSRFQREPAKYVSRK